LLVVFFLSGRWGIAGGKGAGQMNSIRQECDCVVCGNEANLVIECNLVDISDPKEPKILPKDPDVQVMPGV